MQDNGCADIDALILPRGNFGGSTVTLWTPVARSDIAWNFEKFLIDKDGKAVQRCAQPQPLSSCRWRRAVVPYADNATRMTLTLQVPPLLPGRRHRGGHRRPLVGVARRRLHGASGTREAQWSVYTAEWRVLSRR